MESLGKISVVLCRMPTFTPDTYGQKINDEDGGGSHDKKFSMWRHYGTPIQVGYVVHITSGAANTAPGATMIDTDTEKGADSGSGEDGRAVFKNGSTYTITSAEETILNAAGYTTS